MRGNNIAEIRRPIQKLSIQLLQSSRFQVVCSGAAVNNVILLATSTWVWSVPVIVTIIENKFEAVFSGDGHNSAALQVSRPRLHLYAWHLRPICTGHW